MHLKTLLALLCLLPFGLCLSAQTNPAIVPEKIVVSIEGSNSDLQFSVTRNLKLRTSTTLQLPEDSYLLSLVAVPEFSASVEPSASSAATNRQLIVLLQEDGTIAEVYCDDLPPIGAFLGATIRAAYEQLNYTIWRNRQLNSGIDPALILYRKYSIAETMIGFEVVYKESTEEPSIASRLLNNTLAGLDLAVVVPTAGSVSTMMAKGPGKVVAVDVVKDIAAKEVMNLIPEGKLANHLFKGANKLEDTPSNRALIQEISNGTALGVDAYGKSWFAKTMPDGTQIYTYAQNGIVKGAGINQTEIDIVARYGLKQ